MDFESILTAADVITVVGPDPGRRAMQAMHHGLV